MFTLAISCLTTSNLPWFMDLTFQVPMKYCSLPTLGFIFTTSHIHNLALFLLWLSLSFLLELFLCSSPIAYWAPTDLGSSSFRVISFCLFLPFMEFSRQECWSGLPFPSPVDHVLSELSTMTHPPWVALHSMAHSFIVRQGCLTVGITANCEKFLKRQEYQTTSPASWEICMEVRKQQLELDMEQQTGSK